MDYDHTIGPLRLLGEKTVYDELKPIQEVAESPFSLKITRVRGLKALYHAFVGVNRVLVRRCLQLEVVGDEFASEDLDNIVLDGNVELERLPSRAENWKMVFVRESPKLRELPADMGLAEEIFIETTAVLRFPPSSVGFKHLRTLTLRDSKISHLPLDLWTLAPNLEEVDVSQNRLTILPEIGRPCKKLFVNLNALDRIPSLFPDTLVAIRFSDNPRVSSIPRKCFESCANLEELWCERCGLNSFPVETIGSLLKLKDLRVEGNPFRDLRDDVFGLSLDQQTDRRVGKETVDKRNDRRGAAAGLFDIARDVPLRTTGVHPSLADSRTTTSTPTKSLFSPMTAAPIRKLDLKDL